MENIRGIISDLDGTIYLNNRLQMDFEECFINLISSKKKISLEEAEQLFKSKYSELQAATGVKPSELFVLTSINISIFDWLEYSNKVIFPEKYINEDREFVSILKKLKGKVWFDVATNTTYLLSVRILKCIGIADLIDGLWCPDKEIDSSIGSGKPSIKLYKHIADAHSTPPENVVAVGDRWHIDIYGIDSIGMKGHLVGGPEETKEYLREFVK